MCACVLDVTSVFTIKAAHKRLFFLRGGDKTVLSEASLSDLYLAPLLLLAFIYITVVLFTPLKVIIIYCLSASLSVLPKPPLNPEGCV